MGDTDSEQGDRSTSTDMAWRIVSVGAGALAGIAARRAVLATWPGDRSAPPNPADRSVSWSEALAWAVGLGVAGAVTKTIAQRLVASAWRGATGESPPGVVMNTGSE